MVNLVHFDASFITFFIFDKSWASHATNAFNHTLDKRQVIVNQTLTP